MSYFEIKGVLPPMITPFTEDGSVDYTIFERNIQKWNKTGLAGYLVLGSNGETPYIAEEEKLKLIELTVKTAARDKLIMVGTGMESTSATIELTNKAADIGAHCALILTPNYYGDQMNDEEQIAYFTEVADNVKIPVLIYNVTKFTHVNISPKAVSVLSRHKNIIGMKDSSGNIAQLISFMVAGLDEEFNLMVGTASAWYPALAIGVKGSVMALANCAPEECVQVQKLYDEGKYEESLRLYKRMFPVNAAVTGKMGVPALKYVCDKVGYEGGYPRKPLLPVKDEQKKVLDSIVEKAGLLK